MSNSKQWLNAHERDPYVRRAREEGYPSRSSYKLLELHQKDLLFKPGMTIIDLGAAPGGWSLIAKEKVGVTGTVISVDLLPMATSTDVFIQGDFNEPETLQRVLCAVDATAKEGVDLVISDMAPNISGIASIDQPRSLHLAELALDCAQRFLKKGGSLLVKVFQGSGLDTFILNLRPHFKHVKLRKPSASRTASRELYILGKDFLSYNM